MEVLRPIATRYYGVGGLNPRPDGRAVLTPEMFIGPRPDFSGETQLQLSVWVSREGKPEYAGGLPTFWTTIETVATEP